MTVATVPTACPERRETTAPPASMAIRELLALMEMKETVDCLECPESLASQELTAYL